jgi:16S rRNA (guanine527-N7)-methyltransferase
MSRGSGRFPPEAFEKLLEAESLRAGLSVPAPQRLALLRYLSELDSWRRRINLTGVLAPEELAVHALESAVGAPLIPHDARLLDIGSGGGFPGVPLAIVRPDVSVTLLEPRHKRASFLRHVVRVVPVENATVVGQRLEGLGGPTFDVATVRAVGDIAEVIDDASFLSSRGLLLAWTTEAEALAASLSARFALERSEELPGSQRRVIAVLRKVA